MSFSAAEEIEDAFMGNSEEGGAAAAIGSLLVDGSSHLWLGVGSLDELTLRSVCRKKRKFHFTVIINPLPLGWTREDRKKTKKGKAHGTEILTLILLRFSLLAFCSSRVTCSVANS